MNVQLPLVNYCMPVIPSFDLEKSLRFWVDGLGLKADREMREDGRLVGCMVHNDNQYFWLNQRLGGPKPEDYDGVRFYWTPVDVYTIREHLFSMGYAVSAIEERDYGQTEFVLIDDDGFTHCFGVSISR